MSGRDGVRALAPGWRALRIAALGGASLLLATAAHLTGGGALPSPGLLAVVALVLGLVAVPLSTFRGQARLLLPVLAVEQAGLHLVLSAAATEPSAASQCLATSGAHHAALASCSSAHPMGTEQLGHAAGWTMWLGHVAALLATAWLLARGEQWLRRVAEQVARAAGPTLVSFRFAGPPHPLAVALGPAGWRANPPLPARGPPAGL